MMGRTHHQPRPPELGYVFGKHCSYLQKRLTRMQADMNRIADGLPVEDIFLRGDDLQMKKARR